MFTDATPEQTDQLMHRSHKAFTTYSALSRKTRADLMRAIAQEVEALGDPLIAKAMEETHLPEARLKGERARTVFQLNSYADACERGDWLEARINTAEPTRVPPKPDVRKMLVPLGPVVVFGSSNFPFAYSTAGGDTASALAAGCSVVIKAHPAHAGTSEMVAGAINKAIKKMDLPEDLVIHVHGKSFQVGEALVTHPHTKAVGFTGSFSGGMALYNMASQRKEPIPVFAEMGSVNPVYLFEEKLEKDHAAIAQSYAESITLGVGQFCTNPGLIVGVQSPALDKFIEVLAEKLNAVAEGKMLHTRIAEAYRNKSAHMLAQNGVGCLTQPPSPSSDIHAQAILARVGATEFLKNPQLKEEVFGPFSMIIVCKDKAEMHAVAAAMEGQLTSSVMATETEAAQQQALIQLIADKCGRIIMNGVPTGVEVCLAMHHGGPFPSTTDSRFGSVGADAIKRFARPLAFQNYPDALLPDELKNANPLGIIRTVNDMPTKEPVS